MRRIMSLAVRYRIWVVAGVMLVSLAATLQLGTCIDKAKIQAERYRSPA